MHYEVRDGVYKGHHYLANSSNQELSTFCKGQGIYKPNLWHNKFIRKQQTEILGGFHELNHTSNYVSPTSKSTINKANEDSSRKEEKMGQDKQEIPA